MSELAHVFQRVRRGFSPDRVVADPCLNQVFLLACRRVGLRGSDVQLNTRLLNLRKRGALPELKSKRTSFPDRDDYIFASEIAVRHLERKHGVSLDRIICDPSLASEFDAIAARIAPGYTALRYRWAALNLRKTRKLRPETLGHAIKATKIELVCAEDIRPKDLPHGQGLYVFYDGERTLYVGETQNLRKRVLKHLEHSDNKGLARWLWQSSKRALSLELHVLPPNTSARVRRAMEAELIHSRRPVFNVAMT